MSILVITKSIKIGLMFGKQKLWALQTSKYIKCDDSVLSYVIRRFWVRFSVLQELVTGHNS
jgi:hypothetical protein